MFRTLISFGRKGRWGWEYVFPLFFSWFLMVEKRRWGWEYVCPPGNSGLVGLIFLSQHIQSHLRRWQILIWLQISIWSKTSMLNLLAPTIVSYISNEFQQKIFSLVCILYINCIVQFYGTLPLIYLTFRPAIDQSISISI